MKKKPYCLMIDSGLGGLHILAKAHKLCPHTNFLYVADDKNQPYGNKTQQNIEKAIIDIYNHYKTCYSITSIVLACNTATACTIDSLRNQLHIPIIGTEPNILTPRRMHFKNIAILTTPLTAQSQRFNKLISANCQPIICNNLASDIEKSLTMKTDIKINDLIDKIKSINADCIVLGCTHYTFIEKKLMALNLPIFDSIDGVCKQIRIITNSLPTGCGNIIIFTTTRNQKLQNSYIKYYKQLSL